jgi:myosin-5
MLNKRLPWLVVEGRTVKPCLTHNSTLTLANLQESLSEGNSAGGPNKRFAAFKFNSVGSQFKRQLGELMAQLGRMEPHYIRCIKPNSGNKPAL